MPKARAHVSSQFDSYSIMLSTLGALRPPPSIHGAAPSRAPRRPPRGRTPPPFSACPLGGCRRPHPPRRPRAPRHVLVLRRGEDDSALRVAATSDRPLLAVRRTSAAERWRPRGAAARRRGASSAASPPSSGEPTAIELQQQNQYRDPCLTARSHYQRLRTALWSTRTRRSCSSGAAASLNVSSGNDKEAAQRGRSAVGEAALSAVVAAMGRHRDAPTISMGMGFGINVTAEHRDGRPAASTADRVRAAAAREGAIAAIVEAMIVHDGRPDVQEEGAAACSTCGDGRRCAATEAGGRARRRAAGGGGDGGAPNRRRGAGGRLRRGLRRRPRHRRRGPGEEGGGGGVGILELTPRWTLIRATLACRTPAAALLVVAFGSDGRKKAAAAATRAPWRTRWRRSRRTRSCGGGRARAADGGGGRPSGRGGDAGAVGEAGPYDA